MRHGTMMTLLAAAGLLLSGCEKLGDKLPSKPSSGDLPSKPAAPEVSKPASPSMPSAPGTPSAPSTPALPSTPAAGDAASAVARKSEDAKPAASSAKATLVADLSRIKFTTDSAELFGYDSNESRAFYYTNGLGWVVVDVPENGDYEIVVKASCQAAKGENAKFKLVVDGVAVGAETQLKSEEAKEYSFTAPLKQGHRKIGAEFTNDQYKEGEYDLNFYFHELKVVQK